MSPSAVAYPIMEPAHGFRRIRFQTKWRRASQPFASILDFSLTPLDPEGFPTSALPVLLRFRLDNRVALA